MSASTKTEFNPDYFKSIFGDDNEDWRDFIEVNLNTYRDGCDKIKASIESGDMDQIKEVRHALNVIANAITDKKEIGLEFD